MAYQNEVNKPERSLSAASEALLFQRCPICQSETVYRLPDDWQAQVDAGYAIEIVGCGNPWHYDGMNPEDDARATAQAEVARLLRDGIEAFRLTREYVGEAMLPEIAGWSWFDWCEQARAALASQPAEGQE